ncbi:MAG: YraN family protein [Planctomycetes bacterium]|nr:YraN family protein [Planctomycetota bacterium]MBI3844437.1 YraN family protein [Planctomycetota bacterium]
MHDRRRAAAFGAWAEDEAARVYERRGFRIVARNWRTRGGEVDLIARSGSLLVFAEVKAREREDYGLAAESVTATKQRRIVEAATAFLASRGEGVADLAVRFDVVLVTREPAGRLVARLIERAFESE